MTDAEEQSNELLAVRSIYEEDGHLHLLEEKGKHRGIFTALQSPSQPLFLEMNENTRGPHSGESLWKTRHLVCCVLSTPTFHCPPTPQKKPKQTHPK